MAEETENLTPFYPSLLIPSESVVSKVIGTVIIGKDDMSNECATTTRGQ